MGSVEGRFLDLSPDGFCRWVLPDGRVEFANRGLMRLLDLPGSPGEAVGRCLRDLDPAVADLLFEAGRGREDPASSGAAGARVDYERPFRSRRGDFRRVAVHALARPDPDRGVVVVDAVLRDVTLVRGSAETFERAEERRRAILDALPDLIFVLDPRTSVFLDYHCNDPAALLASPSAFLGRHVAEVLPPVLAERTMDAMREVVAGGGVRVFEYDLPIEGELRHYEARHVPCGESVLAIVRDVTDRKRAETALATERQRLAVTLRSIGDGVISTDEAGRVTSVNGVAEALTGWTEEEALGRPLGEVFRIVGERSGVPVEDPVRKVLDSGGVVGLANDTLLLARDGARRVIADSGAPIRGVEGRILGVVLVFRDQTAKRRMEAEAAKMDRLESLGVLAGGIAHDFNNILTALVGNLSVARLGLDERDPARGPLAEAESAAVRAAHLTRQLLAFSRGGVPVCRPTALPGLLRESAALALSGSNVRAEFTLADGIRPVDIDPGQIGQVLHNLVLNAVEAMPKGGVVRVSAENVDLDDRSGLPLPPGPYVVVSVIDDGVGIPADLLPHIFDPFFTTKARGSGLGLSIAHTVVQRHHGLLAAESEVGAGATFRIHLPAAAVPPAVPEPSPGPLPPGSGRILVVDDEASIRRAATRMIERLGYEAASAADGLAAVEVCLDARRTGRPFDLVILDLTVPGGLGGPAALERLREIEPDVPAVASSGYSDDPVLADPARHGFRGVLRKPYGVEEVGRVLADLLAARRGP
jgi:PAS domain S-box-containing protein